MKRVLIVDDSAFTRGIHKQLVAAQGYETLEACGGVEAVEMFASERPDLVMVDLLMPDMDGMEAVGGMLAIDPGARIVVCSTDKQKARRDEATQAGVLEFLVKPIDPEKLSECLHRILED